MSDEPPVADQPPPGGTKPPAVLPPPAKENHPIIAREGWMHVVLAFGAMLFLGTFFPQWGNIVGFLVLAFVVQFFRDPRRKVPQEPGAVICPADGKVIAVIPENDPQTNAKALKISIFMNVFNVHANRAPVSGKILLKRYRPGHFLNAKLYKASIVNEANFLTIRTARGRVTFVQIAGLLARRIICHVDQGETVVAGQRYGFIRFGSRVDVYLPPASKPRVAPGDPVHGGIDIIAWLPPEGDEEDAHDAQDLEDEATADTADATTGAQDADDRSG